MAIHFFFEVSGETIFLGIAVSSDVGISGSNFLRHELHSRDLPCSEKSIQVMGHHIFQSSARFSNTLSVSSREKLCQNRRSISTPAISTHESVMCTLPLASRTILSRYPPLVYTLLCQLTSRSVPERSSKLLATSVPQRVKPPCALSIAKLTDARELGSPSSKSVLYENPSAPLHGSIAVIYGVFTSNQVQTGCGNGDCGQLYARKARCCHYRRFAEVSSSKVLSEGEVIARC